MTNSSVMAHNILLRAFSHEGLSRSQWQDHYSDVLASALSAQGITSQDPTFSPLHNANGSEDTYRVVQWTLTIGDDLSLSRCSALSKSDSLAEAQSKAGIEYVIVPSALSILAKEPGLAVFDMDSTLIQQEVIDELARAVGLYPQVAAITEAAMRGEAPYTDFTASLKARVGLLKGVPTSIWDELKQSTITFTPGAKELTKALRAAGWKTAVLSGGFTPLANWVKDTLGLDHAYANHLVADEAAGVLTGELVADKPIIHAEKKRELLLEIAKKEGIPTSNVIAVGDGSNDLKMMEVAALGIAFNAKPKVQQAAPSRLNSKSLLDVLYVLGFTDAEVEKLLA